ncbi:adenylate/guanylate cyclase domain-containing protein, partial [Chloroflexota bacterium]
MSELLQTIAAYIPPNIVHTVVVDATPAPPTEATIEHFPAAVLFADISGFTPLTEALAQKGAEGPEELTRLLNRYFSWMIAFIETEGGEIVKFGGDALTAIFPAANGELDLATRRATQAAETMQSVMDEFKIMESSVGLVTLIMKIGVGAGEILAARVGGFSNRWEYIIAGDPLRQTAEAEHQAQRGQIVLSPEAQAIIDPNPVPLRSLPRVDWSSIQAPDVVETVLRCYLPAPVLVWLDQDLHGWLASLRPMSVLFVGVNGLDYEQADAIERLHDLVCGVQKIIHHYQGSLPRLTVDDKGTVFLILFGAPPHAHEDDPERALRCALDLQALAKTHNMPLSIGVTTGRVFAGPVGSNTRREYTVMGDTVNLAARLMMVAKPGQICCDYGTFRSTRSQMSFNLLPPVHVKGKRGAIQLYQPTGRRRYIGQINRLNQAKTGETPVPLRILEGRQAELATLTASLAEVQAGHSRIVVLEGEAGIGKSKLIKTLVQSVLEDGLTPLMGQGRSIEQEMPYHAWQDIIDFYFKQETDDGTSETSKPADKQIKRQLQIETKVNQAAPELAQYLPLLNDVLDLDLPENPSTTSLNSASRHKHLGSLLLALLRAWAAEEPPVLFLEDAHWLDPSSWDLTLQVAQALTADRLPLLLVIAMRPRTGEAMPAELSMLIGLTETEHLRLDSLSTEETLTVAAARVGLTGNELPEAITELMRRRAGGNPFFAEELIHALLDNGFIYLKTPQWADGRTRCLIGDELERADQILPATIQSAGLSRIDRLPPEEQLMLRIAAVIGHTFAYTTLRDTLREHLEIDEPALKTLLDGLIYLDLIQVTTPEPNLTYCFKHVIIREVTYQS